MSKGEITHFYQKVCTVYLKVEAYFILQWIVFFEEDIIPSDTSDMYPRIMSTGSLRSLGKLKLRSMTVKLVS